MSKSGLSKASAILIGFSIIAGSASVAFAQNSPPAVTSKQLNQQNQQRINITNIENHIANMREKLASKEATLKLKLQTFRDQKKATAAARINTNLNQINQNQSTQMQRHLDTMSGILDKLGVRINQPTSDIKDPTAAKAAISSAQATIASTSAAIVTQSQKDYTIQVTTENRIRVNAQAMRNKLHTDILSIRKAVIDAKQAVANAIRVAKSDKEATTSGSQ